MGQTGPALSEMSVEDCDGREREEVLEAMMIILCHIS